MVFVNIPLTQNVFFSRKEWLNKALHSLHHNNDGYIECHPFDGFQQSWNCYFKTTLCKVYHSAWKLQNGQAIFIKLPHARNRVMGLSVIPVGQTIKLIPKYSLPQQKKRGNVLRKKKVCWETLAQSLKEI